MQNREQYIEDHFDVYERAPVNTKADDREIDTPLGVYKESQLEVKGEKIL